MDLSIFNANFSPRETSPLVWKSIDMVTNLNFTKLSLLFLTECFEHSQCITGVAVTVNCVVDVY